MTTLYQFDTASAAEQARQALIQAGVPPMAIRLFSGVMAHDAQQERVGSFADGVSGTHDAHDSRTGRFDDVAEHRPSADEKRVGSFADETGHVHDTRRERVGSFADVDQDTETTYAAGTTDVQNVSHETIMEHLQAAGVSAADADDHLAALHAGKSVLLVDTPPNMAAQVQAVLHRS